MPPPYGSSAGRLGMPVDALPGVMTGWRTCSTTRLITLGLGRGAGAAGFGAMRRGAALRAGAFFAATFFAAAFFAGLFFAALFFAAFLLLLPRRAAERFGADFFLPDDFERFDEDFFERFLVAMRFLLCPNLGSTAVAIGLLGSGVI